MSRANRSIAVPYPDYSKPAEDRRNNNPRHPNENIMPNPQNKYPQWRIILRYLPAIVLLPALATRVPSNYHAAREVAGYFQALAFARTGLQSYLFLTPEENLSSLHLHSVLSSPFVGLGYPAGGRLVSFLAALGAVTALAVVGGRLFDRRVSLLAPLFLWLHPFFMRSAFAFQPEALSIALTTGAVAAMIYYTDTDNPRYYAISLVFLALGLATHLWEATIALPLFILLVWERDWLKAGLLAVITIGLTVGIVLITHLQPRGAGTLMFYATFTHGHWTLLVSPEWWLPDLFTLHPLVFFRRLIRSPHTILTGLTVPVSVFGTIAWAYSFASTRSRKSLVMLSWLVSGLTIPFFLARGYAAHDYYIWALLAPLAISLSVVSSKAAMRLPTIGSDRVVRLCAILLVCSAGFYGLVFEAGVFSQTALPVIGGVDRTSFQPTEKHDEAVQIGRELRNRDVSDASSVVFVGDFPTDNVYRATFVSRTLIYSGLLVKERRYNPGGEGPIIDSSSEMGQSCEYLIYQSKEGARLKKCAST